MIYGYVCVAGTFDGLHRGHEALLERAFDIGDRVLIGVTTDTYLQVYKKSVSVSSFAVRLSALKAWTTQRGVADRSVIIPIDNPFEPAASDPRLDAIIVSEQTRARGEEINRMRIRRGLSVLALSLVPMVYAVDHKPISATRVRDRVIDREGRLTMPDSLRGALSIPIGNVLVGVAIRKSIEKHTGKDIIAVGDKTTKTILDLGVIPRLMIIDNKVNRQLYTELRPLITQRHVETKKVLSGPGFISREALDEIRLVFSGKRKISAPRVLDVEGEEDLLVLPALIEAPIGAVIYYGQPDVGMVEVIVTKKKKKEAIALLEKFIHNTI